MLKRLPSYGYRAKGSAIPKRDGTQLELACVMTDPVGSEFASVSEFRV